MCGRCAGWSRQVLLFAIEEVGVDDQDTVDQLDERFRLVKRSGSARDATRRIVMLSPELVVLQAFRGDPVAYLRHPLPPPPRHPQQLAFHSQCHCVLEPKIL